MLDPGNFVKKDLITIWKAADEPEPAIIILIRKIMRIFSIDGGGKVFFCHVTEHVVLTGAYTWRGWRTNGTHEVVV